MRPGLPVFFPYKCTPVTPSDGCRHATERMKANGRDTPISGYRASSGQDPARKKEARPKAKPQ